MKLKAVNINLALKPLFWVCAVMRSFLYNYIEWERMWFNPKNKFKKGDKVKLNWKAKVYFKSDLVKPLPTGTMVFDRIDKDNVVDMSDGDTWNLYWLCRG